MRIDGWRVFHRSITHQTIHSKIYSIFKYQSIHIKIHLTYNKSTTYIPFFTLPSITKYHFSNFIKPPISNFTLFISFNNTHTIFLLLLVYRCINTFYVFIYLRGQGAGIRHLSTIRVTLLPNIPKAKVLHIHICNKYSMRLYIFIWLGLLLLLWWSQGGYFPRPGVLLPTIPCIHHYLTTSTYPQTKIGRVSPTYP